MFSPLFEIITEKPMLMFWKNVPEFHATFYKSGHWESSTFDCGRITAGYLTVRHFTLRPFYCQQL